MKRPQVISIALHTAVIALLLIPISTAPTAHVPRHEPLIFHPVTLPPPIQASAGGGGGPHELTPVSQGSLPKIAPRPLLLPKLRPQETSALMIEPAVDLKFEIDPTLPKFAQLGSPWAPPGPPSNGNGKQGYQGDGGAGPVGPGNGTKGIGPQSGPGINVRGANCGQPSNPVLVYKVEPEFTEEARRARVQGSVMIKAVVSETGKVREPQVTRSLGMGLDERALEAVEKWRFKAGVKDCRAAPMSAWIEVHFHLL